MTVMDVCESGSTACPCRPSRGGRRRPGFTLLEVLVVVAVLSLLVAILLPSLAAARRESRQILCRSNLHGIAGGIQAYLTHHRGEFPQSTRAEDNTDVNFGGGQGWAPPFVGPKPLNPYLSLAPTAMSGTEVFRCPFDTGSATARPTCHAHYGSSYRMNHYLVGLAGVQFGPDNRCRTILQDMKERHTTRVREGYRVVTRARVKINDLASTSTLLMVGDFGWHLRCYYGFPAALHVDWHEPKDHYSVAFADGHAGFVRIVKGLYQTPAYTVIPFRQPQLEVSQCQEEVPCE